MSELDRITAEILDCSVRIHRELGPGLLESVYETVLSACLLCQGMRVERQRPIDIEFEGMTFSAAFRADLLVEDAVIVEIKSVDQLSRAHAKQLLTYLRLMKLPVGLLLNISGATMKEGVKRLVNNHAETRTFSAAPRLRVKSEYGA